MDVTANKDKDVLKFIQNYNPGESRDGQSVSLKCILYLREEWKMEG